MREVVSVPLIVWYAIHAQNICLDGFFMRCLIAWSLFVFTLISLIDAG